jgi:hypothetical protein
MNLNVKRDLYDYQPTNLSRIQEEELDIKLNNKKAMRR